MAAPTTRADKRNSNQIRALSSSSSLLANSDASNKFNHGSVSVLSNLNGPVPIKLRDELPNNLPTLQVVASTNHSNPSTKVIESLLTTLLYPLISTASYSSSDLLQLTVQVLSAPSIKYINPLSTHLEDNLNTPRVNNTAASQSAARNVLSVIINSSVCTLLDGGIELKGLITSVAVASPRNSSTPLLDPTLLEEAQSQSCHLFAFSFGQTVGGTEGICVLADSIGEFSPDQLFEAQDLARTACQSILAFIRKSMENKYGIVDDVEVVEDMEQGSDEDEESVPANEEEMEL